MKCPKENENVEINVKRFDESTGDNGTLKIRAEKIMKVHGDFYKVVLGESNFKYFAWYYNHGWVPINEYMVSSLSRRWIYSILDACRYGKNDEETKNLILRAVNSQFSDFKKIMEWYY